MLIAKPKLDAFRKIGMPFNILMINVCTGKDSTITLLNKTKLQTKTIVIHFNTDEQKMALTNYLTPIFEKINGRIHCPYRCSDAPTNEGYVVLTYAPYHTFEPNRRYCSFCLYRRQDFIRQFPALTTEGTHFVYSDRQRLIMLFENCFDIVTE